MAGVGSSPALALLLAAHCWSGLCRCPGPKAHILCRTDTWNSGSDILESEALLWAHGKESWVSLCSWDHPGLLKPRGAGRTPRSWAVPPRGSFGSEPKGLEFVQSLSVMWLHIAGRVAPPWMFPVGFTDPGVLVGKRQAPSRDSNEGVKQALGQRV